MADEERGKGAEEIKAKMKSRELVVELEVLAAVVKRLCQYSACNLFLDVTSISHLPRFDGKAVKTLMRSKLTSWTPW
jgi:hypothetical protein